MVLFQNDSKEIYSLSHEKLLNLSSKYMNILRYLNLHFISFYNSILAKSFGFL